MLKLNVLNKFYLQHFCTIILMFCSPIILFGQGLDIEKEAVEAFKNKNYISSTQLWKKANDIHIKNDDKVAQINALRHIFKGLMHQFKLDSAEIYIREAITLAKRNNMEVQYGEAMNSLLSVYEFKDQEDSILYAAREILNTENLSHDYYSDSYSAISLVYENKGDLVNQEAYLQKAIDIDMMHKDSSSLPFNLTNLARIKSNKGNYEESISILFEAVAYLRPVIDKFKYASIYTEISAVFLNMNNLQKSEEYAKLSLEYCEKLGLKTSKLRPYNALGKIYKRRGNYQQALSYYEISDSIITASKGRKSLKARINLGMASCKMKLNDFSKVDLLLKEVKELLNNLDDGRLLLNYKSTQAFYKYHSDFRNSLPFILDAQSTAVEMSNLHLQTSMSNLLSEYYYKIGNYKGALDQLKEYNTLKDSLYQIEQSYFVHDLEAQYQKNQQDNQISLLAYENNLKSVQLKQQRFIIYGSLFAVIIFGILLSFIARLLGKVKSQKLVVEKSLSEKDVLLKEIHHRVKNNLQVISSLLALQSKYISDDTALNALKQGQDRVHSMALIHQDLYEGKNLVGVSTSSYFEHLIDNLFYSYNINEEDVKLKMEVEDITLDVDTMIPLGLVLNELVSNAFKHAFKANQTEGEIYIKLTEVKDQLILVVKDNGNSIKSTDEIDGKSFGFELIKAFSQKLKAQLQMHVDNGLSIQLNIKNYNKAA
ncbi:MAG: tetratricopeptide repeat protein [Saprospiraceae bacterium]|nr:tetratricopeptide repeat protein [Saprospiraceae bacterium]